MSAQVSACCEGERDVHSHVLDEEAVVGVQSGSFKLFSRETIEPVEEEVKLDQLCKIYVASVSIYLIR